MDKLTVDGPEPIPVEDPLATIQRLKRDQDEQITPLAVDLERQRAVAQLKRVPLRADVFDTHGAVVYRPKRVPAGDVADLRASETREELYMRMAKIFPYWDGVLDCETGEPLPDPIEDPMVFNRLDALEQVPEFHQLLMPTPRGK